jgi:hypothetical protein
MVMGAVLLVVGIAASIVAVPANVLAAAWFLDEDIDGRLPVNAIAFSLPGICDPRRRPCRRP